MAPGWRGARWKGRRRGQGPPPDCLKGRGRGWAVSRAGCDVGSAFLAVGGVLFFSLSLPLCLFVFFFGEGFGGKEIEVPRLDGGPCTSVRRNVVWGQDWGGE